jgi:glycosyltransferase involved in cell wall biosynthesis
MNLIPRISIITPSFNQGQFLERTIVSVLEQNYSDIEYIVIDGGSTDASVRIIKKYEKYIDFWVSERDKGQSHAINKGFRMSTGEYVGWLNSDDELHQYTLEKVSEAIMSDRASRREAVLYFGILEIVDAVGNHMKMEPFNEELSFESLLYSKAQCLQPGSFYERGTLAAVGFLNENLHFCMDWDLWLRLLKVGVAHFVPHVLAKLRMHPSSKSSNVSTNHVKESFWVFRSHGGLLISKKGLLYVPRYLKFYVKEKFTTA